MSYKETKWVSICSADDVPADGGVAAMLDGKQIAIFHFRRLGKWYATSNACPHWNENVLARGLLGQSAGEAKVVCPLHKRSYSLQTGACLSGDVGPIETYPIRVQAGVVQVGVQRRQQEAA